MGTSAANPDDLGRYVKDAGTARTSLGEEAAGVYSAASDFAAHGYEYGVDMGATFAAVAQHLETARGNEQWVDAVRQAFVNADSGSVPGAVVSVDDTAITARLTAGGLDGPAPVVITVDDPLVYGAPRTSGFADDPVNTASGNLVHQECDLDLPGRACAGRWVRTYNSRAHRRVGAFGPGWSSWADCALGLEPDGVLWTGPDGAQTRFAQDADGYAEAAGLPARLVALADAAGWELRWAQGETWRYEAAGRLVAVDDRELAIALTWAGGQLTRLAVPASGRFVDFEWADDRIVSATASDGRAVDYAYDAAGALVEVRDSVHGLVRYDIADGLLLSIVDADGVVAAATRYDDEGRVLAQTNADGRETTYRYDAGLRCTVTGDDGIGNVYVHDERANLLMAIDGHGYGMRRRFDDRDRLVGWTDRSGNQWTQAFDGADRLVERRGPLGHLESWSWDASGRLVGRVDTIGALTRWAYDGDGRTPSTIIDPTGATTRVVVGADGLPERIVDADGVATTCTWDADGQLLSSRDGEGFVRSFEYDPAGRLAAVVDQVGARVVFDVDTGGRVVAETTSAGRRSMFGYSAAGRRVSYTDAAGADWRTAYGTNGRVAELTDPLGSRVGYQWDACGHLATIVAPDGAKFEHRYDALGRLVQLTDPAGATWLRTYDAEGRMVAERDGDGHGATRVFDELGRVVEERDALGASTSYTHDAAGRILSVTDATGAVSSVERDVSGRVVAAGDALGAVTRYEWTAAGRLAVVVSPLGRRTTYGYDRAGRLVRQTLPSGGVLRFELDALGRVRSVRTPAGRSASWRYDAAGEVVETVRDGVRTVVERDVAGRAVAVTDGAGATWRWAWDARGSAASVADPLGAITSFASDERGRLATRLDPLGGHESFEHDLVGRVVARIDALGRATTWQRNANGHVVAERDPAGAGTRLWRDALGQVSGHGSLTAADPDVRFERDALGRVVAVVEGAGRTGFVYDAVGNLVARVDPAGSQRWRRDADGQLVATAIDDVETSYRYDADGYLVEIRHPRLGKRVLERDADGRRADADADAVAVAVERDAAGRRIAIELAGTLIAVTRDSAGQLVALTEPDGTVRRFDWDLGGRLVAEHDRRGTTRHAYDAAGQLVRSELPDGIVVVYTYDAAGRRTDASRSDGSGTRFGWDEQGCLRDVERRGADGAVTVRRLTTNGLGELVGVDDHVLRWDPTGYTPSLRRVDDVEVVRGDRALLAGDLAAIGDAGLSIDERGAVGFDGLVFQQHRWLEPATSGFLSPDPLAHVAGRPAAANPYHHAWNDPTTYLDPTGLRPLSDEEYATLRDAERKGRAGQAWDAMKNDPWGTLAMVGVVAVGVGLCFVPGGQAIGVGILIGAATSGGIGFATGNFDPRSVAISGIAGGVGGGAFSAARSAGMSMFASGAVSGFGADLTSQQLTHPGHVNAGELVTSTAAGGVLAAGAEALGNQAGRLRAYLRPPTEPVPVLPRFNAGATESDLSAFGNKAGPRAPRPADMEVGSDGMLVPQRPPSPTGASTFGDPEQAPLSGHYHTIPEGTEMPPGVGVVRDGVDVGGVQPATHATIYPTAPMSPQDFIDRFLNLPWQYGGKK